MPLKHQNKIEICNIQHHQATILFRFEDSHNSAQKIIHTKGRNVIVGRRMFLNVENSQLLYRSCDFNASYTLFVHQYSLATSNQNNFIGVNYTHHRWCGLDIEKFRKSHQFGKRSFRQNCQRFLWFGFH